jgi:hypothetical protein
MGQNALDDKDPLEAARALNTRFEHIGHASTANALEKSVLAE